MKDMVRKHDRVLEIYNRLMSGEIVRKDDLAKEYGVNPRSIQRDIDSIRDFYANRTVQGNGISEIQYDHTLKGYKLISAKTVTLTNEELFTITKILLDSRALSKEEMSKIIGDLLNACISEKDKKKVTELIRNEMFHYVEPHHGKNLIPTIWELGNAVHQQKIVDLEYHKTSGEITNASIKPVGIMCSEYYFYLIGYIGNNDKKYPGYPTIYRIDRIAKYKITANSFQVPYKDRFEEGEFRKRIPFMFGGKLHRTSFVYYGPDINVVLDRLPTAAATKNTDGSYSVTVEVYGEKGLELWLKGQNIKML